MVRSWGRERGAHRTEVTKGDRDKEEEVPAEAELEEEEVAVGGGIGRTETSCIERESTTEMLLEEGKARRPEGWQSADPPLFRVGGPGSMQSHDSCGGRAMAFGTAAAAVSVTVAYFLSPSSLPADRVQALGNCTVLSWRLSGVNSTRTLRCNPKKKIPESA